MTTVITFWTFDIVHPGHVYFLKEAKKMWDKLVTIIARDENVLKFKGKAPLTPEQKRVQDIKDLNIADVVELGHESDYFLVIEKYKPDIIALGHDQTYLVRELHTFLRINDSKTRIITLPGFKPEKHKSSIIKKKMK